MEPDPAVLDAPDPRMAGRGRLKLAVVAGVCLLTLFTIVYTLWPAWTTFHVSAETELVRIETGRGTNTSALPLRHAFQADGNARIPRDNVAIKLSDGVTIELHRVISDTLVIKLESDSLRNTAGTVHRGEGEVDTLPPSVRFMVPLTGPGADGSFRLPFRARRVRIGHVPGFITGQRTPLLRSGTVTLVARPLPNLDVQVGSYTLHPGQRMDLPADGYRVDKPGSGLIVVEEGGGMMVNFTAYTRRALVASDDHEERLAAGMFDRARNDPVAAFGWVLVVTLFLSPLGSLVADQMKNVVESSCKRL